MRVALASVTVDPRLSLTLVLCRRNRGWENEYGSGVGSGKPETQFGWRVVRRFGSLDMRDREAQLKSQAQGRATVNGIAEYKPQDDAVLSLGSEGGLSSAVRMVSRDAVFFRRDWASVWQRVDYASRVESEAQAYLRMWRSHLPSK